MRLLRPLFLSFLVLSAIAGAALAQWPDGYVVVDSVRINGNVAPSYRLMSDDAGGAYLFGGRGNLHATRRTGDGVLLPGFPILVPGGSTVPDGANGVIVAFTDGNADVRASHYLPDGTKDPAWPAADVLVCGAAGVQSGAMACSDGAGGAFVVWQDAREPQLRLYVHHVLANGTLAAGPVQGVSIAALTGQMWADLYALAPDGAGGCVVAWQSSGCSSCPLRVQRLTSALASLWTPGGRPMPFDPAYSPQIVADGSGGAYIAYTGSSQIRLWKLDSNGNLATGWDADPLTPGANTTDPALVSDGNGGVLLGWTGPAGARALRIGSGGAIAAGWPGDGLALSGGSDAQQVDLLADGEGGAFAAFGETAAGITTLIAQRFTHDGAIAPGWSPEGLAVRTTDVTTNAPALAATANGVVVMWWERHSAPPFGYHDDLVLAQYIAENTTVSAPPPVAAPAIALGAPRPNPSRGTFFLDVSLASDARATLDLLDVNGRSVQTVDLSTGTGVRQVTLGSGFKLPPGLYFMRLSQGAMTRVTRGVLVR